MITIYPDHNRNFSIFNNITPDLTPMLDMLFILLVFFMLTIGTVFQSFELNLPSTVTETLPFLENSNKTILEIDQKTYRLNGNVYQDMDKLMQHLSLLRNVHPDDELIIASDKNVTIQKVLDVLNFLQSKGIDTANILMKKQE